MTEPEKDQIGDGQDNLGQAAGKAAQAAKQISHEAAATAASKGTEAAINTAAATVHAGMEGGKAAVGVAAGTAAAGPWGAILSAAWAMRHSLFKILICICLFLLIIVILICSIPSIVLDNVFGLNGVPPAEGATLESSYAEMSDAVSAVIDAGYDHSLARVEEIILNGGYDYDLSMDALINHAQSSAGYDVCYILAAYSASLQQQGTSVEDTAAGSSSTGTIRPYGLDCSGFTDWVYKTALGVSIQAGSWAQYTSSTPIFEAELLPGDLGFLLNDSGTTDHVLIFAGYSEDGSRTWVHSEGGIGVHVNTPGYDSKLVLRRPSGVDFSQDVGSTAYGEPLYSLKVNVTHYCACTKCCGPNAQGITASGKKVAVGMVAMSSYYPFGTQIMINGIMYTVEDRGGAGIENDISRVDIFVPDHNEALRLGRFNTTAYIYRIGR